jgi:DNA-binding beta-propeller fold protein YncE
MSELRSAASILRNCLIGCVALVLVASVGAGTAAAEPTAWGGPGGGDGEFSNPWDVAVAPDGTVYVADRGNSRIQYFSPEGEYLGQWGSFGTAPGEFGDDLVGVAVASSGKVFALDAGEGSGYRVQRFDADGSFEAGWGAATGSALGQFDQPSGIAVGPSGRVYVAEAGNRRVQSFASDGSEPAAWGSPGGGGEGQFTRPTDVAVDQSSGDVYVADMGGTARVQAFSSTGTFLRQWGSTGAGDGQFLPNGLVGIAVDPEGDVYTREQQSPAEGGGRVQRFSSSGQFVGRIYHVLGAEPRGIAVTEDALYAPDTGGGRVLVFDLATPEVSLLAPYLPVEVGAAVLFESTASVPLGQIGDYEWDLDGDGVYELDTGTQDHASHVYSTPGSLTVGLRVTSDSGRTAVERRPVEVVVPPLPGPVGVSIDEGASFTRDPHVTVTVRWPRHASSMLVSNDGGFIPSFPMPVQRIISWVLDASGPELQPKVIYFRFSGGASGSETYTDDIVLDRTPPKVPWARVEPAPEGHQRLRLDAKDKVSGVAAVQLVRAGGTPGNWRRFAKSMALRGTTQGLHLRVRDRAGNPSVWKHVRRVCQRCR